ncbi:hypothetical protein TraAM80_07624 [Trypanosoma rangeli]|uniref:Uncharacterized protein n=1 Tax=Trypanosoma rangeli TaxID=5698 RepID=A0A422N4Q9_TRYRA|nr:uncharacterized protein TraAM80_07624 [Trypanosoma rangeli]RNF00445.1 hypothetical protein TraAM80_07624 [Trypanosoma rangeli]|eukprot:RNF00445.1 hypothetical protein TraAM80_07624 [Trypanosoma rangeli]
MGSALFRWEACEADAGVDTFTFLVEDSNAPRFRLKHVAVGHAQDAQSCEFRFYSRYVFLEVFTALQLMLAIFTVYLFNYLGTVRHYYAPLLGLEHEQEIASSASSQALKVRISHRREVLAPFYLSIVILGICFTVFVAAYVVVINSAWWVSLELARWERDQRNRMRHETSQHIPALRALQNKDETVRYDSESINCRLRRLGVRWISCTRPYYVFPPRYLSDFDYRHALHARFGANFSRRSPKGILFLLTSPFVLVLTVIDIITVDEMRVTGVQVSLLQGVSLVGGLLLLLPVVWHACTMLLRCWRTCRRALLRQL